MHEGESAAQRATPKTPFGSFVMIVCALAGACSVTAQPNIRIKVGDPWQDTLEMLEARSINVVDANAAILVAGAEQTVAYRIHASNSGNVFYIVSARFDGDRELRIVEMFWYEDWHRDMQRQRGMRERKLRNVEEVDVIDLQ